MRSKIIIIFIFIVSINIFPWGDEGHRLITSKAVEIAGTLIPDLFQWKEYIVFHSVDADQRKKGDESEGFKHYIDLDYYKEFQDGRMITNKNELTMIYNDSIVTAAGLLPWTTMECYLNLKSAFAELNRDKILIFLSDLAHYVADGYQPLHTILNYDGQKTGQKGLHGRYEISTVQNYLNEIDSLLKKDSVEYIPDPLRFIFNYLENSHSVAEVILAADKIAYMLTGTYEGDKYRRLLWQRTRYITIILFREAAGSLASLIYSAWVDAGRPSLGNIN